MVLLRRNFFRLLFSRLAPTILTHFANTFRVKIAMWIVYGTLCGVRNKSNAKDDAKALLVLWDISWNVHSARFYSPSWEQKIPHILTHNYFKSITKPSTHKRLACLVYAIVPVCNGNDYQIDGLVCVIIACQVERSYVIIYCLILNKFHFDLMVQITI